MIDCVVAPVVIHFSILCDLLAQFRVAGETLELHVLSAAILSFFLQSFETMSRAVPSSTGQRSTQRWWHSCERCCKKRRAVLWMKCCRGTTCTHSRRAASNSSKAREHVASGRRTNANSSSNNSNSRGELDCGCGMFVSVGVTCHLCCT